MRLLFVCTGNICRSPAAEGVMRHLASTSGCDWLTIDSCGTHGYHVGEPPDRRAIAEASRRGYDLSELRARRLRPADFESFDLILAMDRGHLRLLDQARPAQTPAELRLFGEFIEGTASAPDIPDPYYGGREGFATVFDLIEAGCHGLLERLRMSRDRKQP